MMQRVANWVAVLALATVMLVQPGLAQTERNDDPVALGHPLSYWMKVIRDRDIGKSNTAFDAIVEIGPAAWRVIPELKEMLAAPFTPIQMGKDTRDEIRAKLLEIHLKAGAIDGLGAIGHAASSAAESMIRWGLTIRVVPPPDGPVDKDPFYIDLVGIDVLERMRVAGAVARLGPDAADAVQALLDSPDNEKRKFAAAILNDVTVSVATDLMRSESCEDRIRGLSLLSAMWPVVAKDHLVSLSDLLRCIEEIKEPEKKPGQTIMRLQRK